MFKLFSYWVLENEIFEHFVARSAEKEGEGVQKIAGKIRYLIQDAFVDDPLVIYLLW